MTHDRLESFRAQFRAYADTHNEAHALVTDLMLRAEEMARSEIPVLRDHATNLQKLATGYGDILAGLKRLSLDWLKAF
jgi:hypothetical protein